MGTRGPIPKRVKHLRRDPNKHVDNAPSRVEGFEPPDADERWHPVARRLYEAASRSGQAHWYEQSDWAILWTLCESISRDLKPKVIHVDPETGEKVRVLQPIRGSNLTAYTRVMGDLMLSEGARRRARIELVRGDADDNSDGRKARITSLQDRLRA